MSETTWNPLLEFDTDDHEFRRGFEMGLVWMRLYCKPPTHGLTFTVHADCTEMLMRILEARGVEFRAEPAGGDWLHVKVKGTVDWDWPGDAVPPKAAM